MGPTIERRVAAAHPASSAGRGVARSARPTSVRAPGRRHRGAPGLPGEPSLGLPLGDVDRLSHLLGGAMEPGYELGHRGGRPGSARRGAFGVAGSPLSLYSGHSSHRARQRCPNSPGTSRKQPAADVSTSAAARQPLGIMTKNGQQPRRSAERDELVELIAALPDVADRLAAAHRPGHDGALHGMSLQRARRTGVAVPVGECGQRGAGSTVMSAKAVTPSRCWWTR
jgi:hypothetical protein